MQKTSPIAGVRSGDDSCGTQHIEFIETGGCAPPVGVVHAGAREPGPALDMGTDRAGLPGNDVSGKTDPAAKADTTALNVSELGLPRGGDPKDFTRAP